MLNINVHEDVFRLQDPRTQQLLHGKISVEAVVHTLAQGDPMIFINSTLYALSENEYYALSPMRLYNSLSNKDFDWLLSQDWTKRFSPQDLAFITAIKEHASGCSSCQRRRNEVELLKLVHKYSIILPDRKIQPDDQNKYPGCSGKIRDTVTSIYPELLKPLPYERTECLDCVQKHVGQAWITGNECLMGYPEHLPVCEAHLEEALEETPKDRKSLIRTLLFCIAKTKAEYKPFVPLDCLSALIENARSPEYREVKASKEPPEDMRLELTEKDKEFLKNMEPRIKAKLSRALEVALDFPPGCKFEKADVTKWIGALASASDIIVGVNPEVANIIRNRRVLFSGDPGLATYPYDCKDILESMRK